MLIKNQENNPNHCVLRPLQRIPAGRINFPTHSWSIRTKSKALISLIFGSESFILVELRWIRPLLSFSQRNYFKKWHFSKPKMKKNPTKSNTYYIKKQFLKKVTKGDWLWLIWDLVPAKPLLSADTVIYAKVVFSHVCYAMHHF